MLLTCRNLMENSHKEIHNFSFPSLTKGVMWSCSDLNTIFHLQRAFFYITLHNTACLDLWLNEEHKIINKKFFVDLLMRSGVEPNERKKEAEKESFCCNRDFILFHLDDSVPFLHLTCCSNSNLFNCCFFLVNFRKQVGLFNKSRVKYVITSVMILHSMC